MNAQEFTISKIKIILEKFPRLKAIYEIDRFDKSHYVEFFPESLHEGNKSIKEIEAKFIFEFITLFPFESLSFFSGNDILKIENSFFEAKGKDYNLYEFNLVDLILDNFIGEFPKAFLHDEVKVNKIPNIPIAYLKLIPFEQVTENDISIDNYQFAMAA